MARATGGTITYTNGNVIHTFTSSDTFVPDASLTVVRALIIGGGGGGGSENGDNGAGGGGGAGGFQDFSSIPLSPGSYSVTVGGGGAGAPSSSSPGTNGGNSSFAGNTSIGGGGGGGGGVASSGGSGGGATGGNGATGAAYGSGTGGQGNNGGTGSASSHPTGGGGGGAGTSGNAGNGTSSGGAGGAGAISDITGAGVTYAGGGGGGGSNASAGAGGSGGGGNGGGNASGSSATANTGSGGGGSGRPGDGVGRVGGNGAAGIVIISYLDTELRDNSVKANIKSPTSQPITPTANILVTGTKQANSAKANVIPVRGIKDTSALANVQFTHYEKKYDYRVYDGTTGTYVGSWSSDLISEPNFRTIINGGPGELVVQLRRPIDDFGEGVDISLNNKVELWCADRDIPSGMLLYAGTISGYRPILDGHKEYLEVTLLHDVAQLAQIFLRNPDLSTTLTETLTDPSQIFKDIIDRYRSDGGRIFYSGSSVDNTNTAVTYTFQTMLVSDAITRSIELTPFDWYYRIDPDNTFHLHNSNFAAADHTLYIGKHINYMETWRRSEDIVNRVYFIGGGSPKMYRQYSNTGSIATYGLRTVLYSDYRVTDANTADVVAAHIINAKKDPEIRTTLKILDNNGLDARKGYDIESFKVGQTLRIFGLKSAGRTTSLWDNMTWDQDVWDQTIAAAATDVLQIQSITYDPEMVTIEASSRVPVIAKRIEDLNKKLQDLQVVDTPVSPTLI